MIDKSYAALSTSLYKNVGTEKLLIFNRYKHPKNYRIYTCILALIVSSFIHLFDRSSFPTQCALYYRSRVKKGDSVTGTFTKPARCIYTMKTVLNVLDSVCSSVSLYTPLRSGQSARYRHRISTSPIKSQDPFKIKESIRSRLVFV